MKMQLGEIARALRIEGLSDKNAEVIVTSIAFDSRQVNPGALFVPLTGEQDGHHFVNDAINKGAVATFWQQSHEGTPTEIPSLEVKDPLKALQTLATYYLIKVNPKIVAITGSNGKTTTKDMTAAVLGSTYNVFKTQGNFNNEIGVPMTILGMSTNTEVLVVEMGMDRPGQLDFLSKMVEPDLCIITMVGEAHIEFFGSREKIADAKLEIVDGMKDDGLLIYNGDEPLLRERVAVKDLQTLTFGEGTRTDIYPTKIEASQNQTNFMVSVWPETEFTIPLMGQYNVNNAMAALLVGKKYHIAPDVMRKSLAEFILTKNRTEWFTGDKGEAILSDVYNANPTAMKEVLISFSHLSTQGRRVAVLGDMLELGEQSAKFHQDIAEVLDPEQIHEVFLYGTEMKSLFDKLQNKYDAENLFYEPTNQQRKLIQQLDDHLLSTDMVMIKGSNGMHLDKVVEALM